MSDHTYRWYLKRLGWTQKHASDLFRAGDRTGRAWATGTSPVPFGNSVLVRLIHAGKITEEDVEWAAKHF